MQDIAPGDGEGQGASTDPDTCWYCGRGRSSPVSGFRLSLIKTSSAIPMQTSDGKHIVPYEQMEITVPRCASCAANHLRYARREDIMTRAFLGLGILGGFALLFLLLSLDWTKLAFVALFGVPILGAAIGSILGGSGRPQNIKWPGDEQAEYPELTEKLRAGWQIGVEPKAHVGYRSVE